ncbi:nucleotide-binding universal stress UspA family protein [Saonia flava]|uniref:Nucleotide-binding universal stress UspA family protein n=1 Tax=Saonia flava TaxID=523696 RepID=A0A846R480_9FLAO|nr:universal stress protein [Saonia flava]NJB72164.1 nucleotide-binding universal stress UspA family protein [Saonia flava]
MLNILTLTDFSNDAYNALFYATQLFKAEKCNFYILNTFNEHTALKKASNAKGKSLLKILEDESVEELEHVYHRIMLDTDSNPLHTFTTLSKKCDLLDHLENIIQKEKIDFVFMGNKGKTGAKDIFLGGNTIHAIKTIKKCPLICIPKEIDFRQPEKVVLSANYEEEYSPFAMNYISKIMSLTKASLHILHLSNAKGLKENQISKKNALSKSLQNFIVEEHLVPYKKTKAMAINEFIEKEHMDMAILVKHHHSFLQKILREPVIFDISFYLNIPFVIIPDED